jgi:hypothetical protein
VRIIISYITDFFRKDFQAGYYISIAVILAAGIILNYEFDLKDKFILGYSHSPQYFFRWLFFFTTVYFFVLLVQAIWKNDFLPFRNKKFLLKISIGLLLLAFDSYSRDFFQLIMIHIPRPLIRWTYYMFTNINQFLFLGIALYVVKFFFDRREKHLYGFTVKGFIPKPYFLMILIVLPMIVWASFQTDFLKSYPIYKDNFGLLAQRISPWKAVGSFELFYALRFFAVEVFFRGFLIIGMLNLIGERAIMPMVVLYSFWHFGKPVMETVGAAFGGYILGIIALRSGSVFGGIIVHYGIALLMETVAYIQIYLLKN